MTWSTETMKAGEKRAGQRAALEQGEIPILRITGSAPEATRAAARAAVDRTKATVTQYSNGALTTIGPYIAAHLRKPETYFARRGEIETLFADPETDPRPYIMAALADALGLKGVPTLTEPQFGAYAAGVVRVHADGVANPLHNDNLARDAAGTGLVLERATCQLSVIYCIDECTTGGELVHYRKRWSRADETHKIVGGLGYERAVVEGVEAVTFRPSAGDLYLINPTHYHEILAVGGASRVTLGMFLLAFDANPDALSVVS